MTLTNNGQIVYIEFEYASGLVPQLYSIVLGNRYQLSGLQFHFSDTNNTGSEHSIDGTTYDIEAQLIFTNVKYDIDTALTMADGVAIVSKFLTGLTTVTVSSQLCDSWHALLQYVVAAGTSTITSFPYVNSLADILGNAFFSYYSYEGSLTTPDCNEVVTWMIGIQPVRIPFPAIRKFRTLLQPDGDAIAPNVRPQQALNGRTVTLNHVPYFP